MAHNKGAAAPVGFHLWSLLLSSCCLWLIGTPWHGVEGTSQPSGLCFEKLTDMAAIYMQEHPAGGMAVVATQRGLMTLQSLPHLGSNQTLTYLGTWLDLTARVNFDDNERGLLSFAFHPQFATNGRFFISYNCDATVFPDCIAPCMCNPAVNCTLGVLDTSCDSALVVGEYWAGPEPLQAKVLMPREVQKVLLMARPYKWHNGGHIFFGHDGYLYISSGDGGNEGDPWDFAVKPNTMLGKILRIDVDNVPAGQTYRVPPTNPFLNIKGALPEIYALGFRQPWRCDQDPVTKAILCGDVGGDQVEEINWVRPGRNYQWHNMEGTIPLNATNMPDVRHFTPTRLQIGIQTGPHFEYSHNCTEFPTVPNCLVDGMIGLAVIGGVFYGNHEVNTCLKGQYLYSDYSGPMWVGDAHNRRTKQIPSKCSPNSPLPCEGFVRQYSWGKDLAGNAYVLAATGIHRVVEGANCGYAC